MKKFLLILLFFMITMPAIADSWEDFGEVERMWDGQKSITNKEFEEAMDLLQSKQKQKEEKQKKKKIKKVSGGGNSLHSELNLDKQINEIPDLKASEDEGALLNLPVRLILGDKVLEQGYYSVLGYRDDNGKPYLAFYQSQSCKGEVAVTETEDDFNENEINFVKLLPYNKSFMRMIFGSLDFNAFAIIPYFEE